MKRYENLESAMCRELEKLNKKYANETEMTAQDSELADLLFHALKSAETYYAMANADEERSRRGSRNGRYMSHEEYYSRYPEDRDWR